MRRSFGALRLLRMTYLEDCAYIQQFDKLEFSYTFDNRIILKNPGKRNSMFFGFLGYTEPGGDKKSVFLKNFYFYPLSNRKNKAIV